MPKTMTKQIPKTHSPIFTKPDLSTLYHKDDCRYYYDPEFCTCGADAFAELEFYKTAYKELETALQKQQEEHEQLNETNKKYKQALGKIAIEEANLINTDGGHYRYEYCEVCTVIIKLAAEALSTK